MDDWLTLQLTRNSSSSSAITEKLRCFKESEIEFQLQILAVWDHFVDALRNLVEVDGARLVKPFSEISHIEFLGKIFFCVYGYFGFLNKC